ncbi:acyltransferase [Glycomyces sp. L485]|uniref:acyltransferase family protein n=1 Tax=Glycomyces sp. L485 TaxID=2909235 RepID=UPI001F4AD762|nr:acyltransferase family protein [Glycomyces sp. L485]MCH7232372.1 acyltransferase [Glycomyces sp. L485]
MNSAQSPTPRTWNGPRAAFDDDTLQLPVAARGPYSQRTEPGVRPAPGAPPDRWEGTGFRPDIQGMRAIAVMLVLLSHAGFAFAAGGYVGVDAFFVLSGFLITSLLIKEVFDTGTISIAGFYARRARRILPASTAVTLVTVVAVVAWFPVTRLEEALRDAFAVVVYMVNYLFVISSTEYLNADAMPSPFQQYWSLAVEEQFYMVWPLLLLCLLLVVRRVPRKALTAGVVFCVAIIVVSLAASVLVTQASQPTAYYATHTRAWELAAGALLALTLQTWKRTPRAVGVALGFAGLAAVAGSAFLFDEGTAFPGYAAVVPVTGTMMLIVAGTAQGTNPVSSLLSTAPFQYVGKISFSLYLWHWPILVLGPLAIGVDSSLALNIALLVGAFAVAQFSYEYIETPVRNARFLKVSDFRGLATGVACSIVGLALILGIGFARVPDRPDPVDLSAVEAAEGFDEVQQRLREAAVLSTMPSALLPALTGAVHDVPSLYGNGCHLEYEQVGIPDDCVFGDPDAETTVVLFGDSHAAHWFPTFEAIGQEQGWRLLSRTKSDCTPVFTSVMSDQLGREYTECEQWRQAVLDEIDRESPDLVVLATTDDVTLTEGRVREWKKGWTDLIDRAGESAGEVVALTDTPRSDGAPVSDCVAIHQDEVQVCALDQEEAVENTDLREAGIEVQKAEGVTVIDTVQWLCVDGVCPPIVGDMLVLRDTNHITTPYAKWLSNVMLDELPAL